ncbi:hypothetical protein SCHPADRAFT_874908 [Schizopora paradoxa]|uniref:BZIP domain-containing protein n=1 Tax=Schizopora paradoxa TaxID=27342 RepID=A0A0H2RLH4_9AGAM|nr:hypothetical protein SCHPADRAFT_874908 [Schizopora paradoxa]
MGSEERDSRSVSHDRDLDDSDLESTQHDGKGDGGGSAGKPGRKKNPNSAAARRDQNRIAQREFRLRKQQRIRDLEARVELLSGTKEETVSEMRNMMKDLMAENAQLRNLIRSLGNYIGDGLGGVLPALGFDRPQEFVDFLNKAETDTAFESFQRRKKSTQVNQTKSPNPLSVDLSKKRSLDEGLLAANKRSKSDHPPNGTTAYSPLLPGPSSAPYNPSPPMHRNSIGPASFSDLLSGTGSSMYMTGPGPDSPNHFHSSPAHYPPVFHPPLAMPSGLNGQTQNLMPTPPPPTATSLASSGPSPQTAPPPDDDDKPIDDPKLHEATKLIHYHLDNYKRNNAYCLPQSLRPTLVQRTVPHESVIDGIIHPELRDRMILLRGRFDLVECLHLLVKNITLHGDDVLAHANWEIGETWLRHFGYLVDQPVLNTCNKWRRERGDAELQMSDIAIAQPDIPTGQ